MLRGPSITGVHSRSLRRGPSVHAFEEDTAFARRLARRLGTRLAVIRTHRFPDGETLVRVAAPSSGRAILVCAFEHPNCRLFESMLAADAMRHAGARHVTLAAPYLPYMRQDTVFRPGEPVSQRVMARMLTRGFDSIVTIEPHLHRVRNLPQIFGRRARSISAAPAIAQWLKRARWRPTIVGPDRESRPWIRRIAKQAGLQWVVGEKRRLGDRTVRVTMELPANMRHAVLVDDIASSGATLAAAARALKSAGIAVVDAIIVHAIFAPGALERIRAAGIRRIVSCDTIPHPTNAIRCAPLLAAAVRKDAR